MAKSKDRLMLEEIFEAAAESGLYQESCDDGKKLLKTLAKHLNRPMSDICGEPINKCLVIYTDEFEIPDVFEDNEDDPSELLTVEVVVSSNGKRIKGVEIDQFYWN
jgi:hypothetical protein